MTDRGDTIPLYFPGRVALETGRQLDNRQLSTQIMPEGTPPPIKGDPEAVTVGADEAAYVDPRAEATMTQREYIAGAFGFVVGPRKKEWLVSPAGGSYLAYTADVVFPRKEDLPELPERNDDGARTAENWYKTDEGFMTQVQGDAIYAAHFLADHPNDFPPGGQELDGIFKAVKTLAEGSGEVTIESPAVAGYTQEEARGYTAFLRQVARFEGYAASGSYENEDNSRTMKLSRVRAGFEAGAPLPESGPELQAA